MARQVVGMFAVDQEEEDRVEEAVAHIRVVCMIAVLEVEELVGHSFVYFEGTRFGLAEVRQEGTCLGCRLPVLVDLIFEDRIVTRRIDLFLTVVEWGMIHYSATRMLGG